MKKDFTELVFILDKSGSMHGLEADTIGGYNSMLENQQAVAGECRITTVLFNDGYALLHDRLDLCSVGFITEKEYQVGGSTALLDAIGKTIHKIGNVQKHTASDYRAEKVMFVIVTDGQENASREYSVATVKAMIEQQKEKYGWEFIFLGANMDAVETAKHYGIAADRAVDYLADRLGTELSYAVMERTVTEFREKGTIDDKRFEAIRDDVKRRGKK